MTAHSLSVCMLLDDVTVDSGCMQFLPGSHRSEIVTHRNVGLGEPARARRPRPDVSPSVGVSDPGRCGKTVHHCRTIHYSGPNCSERPLGDLGADPRTGRAAQTPLLERRPRSRSRPSSSRADLPS